MKNPRIPPGAKEPVADADGDATAAAEATDAAANNEVGAGDAGVTAVAAATAAAGLTTATTRGATVAALDERAGESLRDDAAGAPADREPRRSAVEEPPAVEGVDFDARGPADFPPSATSDAEPVSACATAAPPANTAPTPNVNAPAPNHAYG